MRGPGINGQANGGGNISSQLNDEQMAERGQDQGSFENDGTGFQDFSQIKMKEDSDKFPLWIGNNSHIFLEAFSPLYREATGDLISIAEPLNRPTYIHEYVITPYSIYAAASTGLTKDKIFLKLEKLMKNEVIPKQVMETIRQYSGQYGKARLVLKAGRCFIETVDEDIKEKLLDIPVVSKAHRDGSSKAKEDHDLIVRFEEEQNRFELGMNDE